MWFIALVGACMNSHNGHKAALTKDYTGGNPSYQGDVQQVHTEDGNVPVDYARLSWVVSCLLLQGACQFLVDLVDSLSSHYWLCQSSFSHYSQLVF